MEDALGCARCRNWWKIWRKSLLWWLDTANLNFRYWLLPTAFVSCKYIPSHKRVAKFLILVIFIIIRLLMRWQRAGRMMLSFPIRIPWDSRTVRDFFGYGSSWEVYTRGAVRLVGFTLRPGEAPLRSWETCKFPVTLGSHQRLCMWLPCDEGLNDLNVSVLCSKQHWGWSWGTSHCLNSYRKPDT